MIDRTGETVVKPTAPAPTRRARVSVLGPITVEVDGVGRPVTGRRPRAALGCLALHTGEAVSADRLLDEVWGDDLPLTGVRAVAYQIAKLRSLLEPDRTGEGTLITTTPAGYVLQVAASDVDARRFEDLVDAARAVLTSDPARCEELLVEAMALWRGRPFTDLGDEPFVEREARRLGQLRVVARRSMAEARIELGRASEVVGELEELVGDDPLDESLVGLLMAALHGSGRTADALRTYGDLRRRLSAELGIEPSHELQHLEQRLLNGGDDDPAAIRDIAIRPRGVPAAATSFVGRSDELAEIAEWLESARLVTLCGFGGLGKTRLAQELAGAINDRFADGVWYVDLAPIADPDVLPDTIITAGRLTSPRDRDPVEHLLMQVADREKLIVLDNCEHLVDDVAELVDKIIRRAPLVRVLATSRVHLGVRGEAVFTVHPLPTHSAVELFTDRARLARPGLAVGDSNRHAVERLVEQLDGIPLAIEMAAARLAVMSLAQIVEHLDDRFRLLTNTGRRAVERQQSLTSVMDWNYELLDETEQVLLRRMSVCVGGFNLDAAGRIGTSEPATSSLADVLDRLGHLVEASFMLFEGDRGTPRYRMLETVRQYAAAKLDPDERDEVALVHATHYDIVNAIMLDPAQTTYDAGVRFGDEELGNLRVAMSWAYRNNRPRLGLSIAYRARFYFWIRMLDRELVGWLRKGLELVEDDDEDTLQAAAATIDWAHNALDVDAQRFAAARVEQGLDSVDDPGLRADLLHALAVATIDTDPRAAEADLKMGAEQNASDPIRAFMFLSNRIELSWEIGELADGEAILRRLGEILAAMVSSSPTRFKIEAGVAARAGRWADVVQIAEIGQGHDQVTDTQLRLFQAEALGALGCHDDALETLRPLDPDVLGYLFRFADLIHASIDLRRGETRSATARLTAMADEVTRDGRRLAIGVQIASLLAVAAHDFGRYETAVILFGHAAREQARLDITLRPSDRPLADAALESCRSALGADRFDELAGQGAAMEFQDLPRSIPDDSS